MAGAEVQSSAQSPLLGELGCLTGATEAQGSVIDLTSQSCRAPSPSFTPPTCQPHTTCDTLLNTHSPGVCECTDIKCGQRPSLSHPLCERISHIHVSFHGTTHRLSLCHFTRLARYFSSLEKLNGAKSTVSPSVFLGCLEVMKWKWAVERRGKSGRKKKGKAGVWVSSINMNHQQNLQQSFWWLKSKVMLLDLHGVKPGTGRKIWVSHLCSESVCVWYLLNKWCSINVQ